VPASVAAVGPGRDRKTQPDCAKTRATLGNVPRPVTDIRAGVARRRYSHQVGGAELPVPVEAIANDLCNDAVERIAGGGTPETPVRPGRRSHTNRTDRR
jgi:hypothetical protein